MVGLIVIHIEVPFDIAAMDGCARITYLIIDIREAFDMAFVWKRGRGLNEQGFIPLSHTLRYYMLVKAARYDIIVGGLYS